jgi:hypothetical protein
LAHDRGEEGGLADDEPELADEAARAVDADDALAVGAVGLDDRDPALEDDDELAVGVALAVEDVAGLRVAPDAERLQALDLLGIQPRIGAVEVGRLLQRLGLGQGLHAVDGRPFRGPLKPLKPR